MNDNVFNHPQFQQYLQQVSKDATLRVQGELKYKHVNRSFEHEELAASPSYRALRQALSDVANETVTSAPGITLAEFLDAVRDMAVTSIYGDWCARCRDACYSEGHEHGEDEFPRSCGAYLTVWPYGAERQGDRMFCWYTCSNDHSYEVNWTASPDE